jgi:hypothetical protein
MANVDDRLAVQPAGVREQDLRKSFQSDRVESVRRQTLIPPSSACMRPALNEEISEPLSRVSERPGKKREKAPPPLPAWLTCERLTVRPAGVREQDSRKRFQSDRVESVRSQTPQLCLHG